VISKSARLRALLDNWGSIGTIFRTRETVRVWNFDDGKSVLNFIAAPGYKPQVAAAK